MTVLPPHKDNYRSLLLSLDCLRREEEKSIKRNSTFAGCVWRSHTWSGDKYPTSSLIIPIVYGVYDNIKNLCSKISTTAGETFVQTFRNSMNVFKNSFRLLENTLAAKDDVKAESNNSIRVRNAVQSMASKYL